MNRKYNFSAGPSTMPLEVLNQLSSEIVNFHGEGMSLIEASHRSAMYDGVHSHATDMVRELLSVPDDFDVLFLGGGATLQFSMVPLNFLTKDTTCDFVVSGSWSLKALEDAEKVGGVNVLFEGSESLPTAVEPSDNSAYLHITSNETIGGVQWQDFPQTGTVPLIADMSSDIMSRPIPWRSFSLVYAGAQKNLGPAGVTLVIAKKTFLDNGNPGLTAYLDYRIHAGKASLYNTPPVFSIWALSLVTDWVKSQGGLSAMEELAEKRSSTLYGIIDGSDGFFRCPVAPEYRSKMNVVFRLPSEALEKQFIAEAESRGMSGLKGHRSVGGCRASLYNAMPVDGANTLAEFMKEFKKSNT